MLGTKTGTWIWPKLEYGKSFTNFCSSVATRQFVQTETRFIRSKNTQIIELQQGPLAVVRKAANLDRYGIFNQ
jgi:hypothetical protein